MKYEWFIGLRYLKAKRKQTFISIITIISIVGVAVGVMALIIVLAVMSGFEKTLKEKILGTQAHLVVLKAGPEGMDHYEEVLKQVQEVKGVVSAAPFIFNQVMLSSEANVTGGVVKGIDPDRVGKVTELAHNMKTGRLQDLKGDGDFSGHCPRGGISEASRCLTQRCNPGDLPSRDHHPHGDDAQDEAVSCRGHLLLGNVRV